MIKIQELVGKLRTDFHTKSIVADLEEKWKFNCFSEASKRTIRELRNIELYELGEVSKTVQGPAFLKTCT